MKRDGDWKIETYEKNGGGFPPPSRFRLFGVRMGYTQTECGFRKPWMLLEEAQEYAEQKGRPRDAAEEDLMDDNEE